jgi:hypothetical protein
VIAPDDARYDQARSVFYRSFDRHPAVIIRPADAGDRTPWITMIRVREGETPMEDRWSSTIQ